MMKATGIVRKVDQLGRVVLPVELRRTLGVEVGDGLEIYVNENSVILKPYKPACIFCGEATNTTAIKGKLICQHCLEEMAKL